MARRSHCRSSLHALQNSSASALEHGVPLGCTVPIAGRTASHIANPSEAAAVRIHGGAVVSTEPRAAVRTVASGPSAAPSAAARARGVDDVDDVDDADEAEAMEAAGAGAEVRRGSGLAPAGPRGRLVRSSCTSRMKSSCARTDAHRSIDEGECRISYESRSGPVASAHAHRVLSGC